MSIRVRNHVNPLSAKFIELRGAVPDFPTGRPIELEIGCADAQFLFERAAAEPDRVYVGLEIRAEIVRAVNERARSREVPVWLIFCNANHHLREIFQPRSVARVYVNFPDPWFKRRHRNRRMLNKRLVREITRILEPGGELFFQTDVWDVALDALANLEERDDELRNRAGSWSFWKQPNPYGVRSWREQKCERDGLPIWRLLFDRAGGGRSAR